MSPVDPRHLTPEASLNRMPLRGKSAYEFLGAQALFQQICQHQEALQIPSNLCQTRNNDVFRIFDACLMHSDAAIRGIAQHIATDFGQTLGELIQILTQPSQASQILRPDWDETYWEYWHSVQQIWLGGGLIRGHLRDHLLADIRSVLTSDTPAIHLVDWSAYLPLIGAALCVPASYRRAVVLDFGGTSVKRGIADYKDGCLISLSTLPSLDVPDLNETEVLREWVWTTIDSLWGEVQPDSPILPVAMASYFSPDGNPLPRQGGYIYAQIRLEDGSLQAWFNARSLAKHRAELGMRLLHDGTCAATVHPDSATITLGTALGVGLTGAVANPLGLASHFTLT